MAVKPISPSQVINQKKRSIPDVVFEVFNELIFENYSNCSAHVRQEDVVARLVDRGLDRAQIFAQGWLDIEPVYQRAGWEVEYDKPGFNESYPAVFKFSKKRR